MVLKKKEMRPPSETMKSIPFPFSPTKHNHVFVKLALSFILMGLAFRLFISDSISFPSNSVEHTNTPPSINAPQSTINESPVAYNDNLPAEVEPLFIDTNLEVNETQSSDNVSGKCDLFIGDWIPDSSGPFYTNQTCLVMEDHQNCMKNGKPDSEYLYWRWSPRGCNLPKFDPEKFLELMRNKSWGFIGDSISRNHVQSLICILSQVEPVVETYHDPEYRSKIWRFPSYNFTLSVIWTPFLIKAAVFEDINGVSSSEIQLHLDELDEKWTKQYRSFDYVVIAGGKWFLKTAIYYENNEVKGCHYCPGKNLTELGFDYAYRKALNLIFEFFARSDHRAFVFFRTSTPDHFENGEWFSGGTCNRTVPFKEGEVNMRDVDEIMRNIELEEFETAASTGSGKGVTFKLLDTTRLSLLRPDGHPGPYRQYQPFAKDKNAKVQNDCLHWCLPGPIDSWNDLVMEVIVNAGENR